MWVKLLKLKPIVEFINRIYNIYYIPYIKLIAFYIYCTIVFSSKTQRDVGSEFLRQEMKQGWLYGSNTVKWILFVSRSEFIRISQAMVIYLLWWILVGTYGHLHMAKCRLVEPRKKVEKYTKKWSIMHNTITTCIMKLYDYLLL